jgi:hypothetical protein
LYAGTWYNGVFRRKAIALWTLKTTASPFGGGKITISKNTLTYVSGTVVTLTAEPLDGYTFIGWSGGIIGNANPIYVVMDSNKVITANFTKGITYTLTPLAGTGGSIFPDTPQVVPAGGNKTFIITPLKGYEIESVKIDGVLCENCNFYAFTKVVLDHSIRVSFKKEKKQSVLVLYLGYPEFLLGEVPGILDSPPIMKNGRTLIPLRGVIEALGGMVAWDKETGKITTSLGGVTVELWLEKNIARVNDESILIDPSDKEVIPEIIKGRVMLPLNFIARNFGMMVNWEGGTIKTIIIKHEG